MGYRILFTTETGVDCQTSWDNPLFTQLLPQNSPTLLRLSNGILNFSTSDHVVINFM